MLIDRKCRKEKGKEGRNAGSYVALAARLRPIPDACFRKYQ
jgi:hypothetical protein